MILYSIIALFVLSILFLIFHKLSNLPHNVFKKILNIFLIFILILFALIFFRINPTLLGTIPAIALFLFRWRNLLKFLGNLFFKNKVRKNSSSMTKKEAYDILGLQEGASEKEVLERYYDLLKKNHPDRGGSDWFSARLNKAKETLLG